MSQPLIYAKNGKYYDLVYGGKDYGKEIGIIEKLIAKYKVNVGSELLDVGCGTGEHLRFLSTKYDCTGIDINQNLLDIASKKNNNIEFRQADMIDFDLGKKFDIITCLFSAIGYVKTLDNLEFTLKRLFEHLNVGGVLIIEPWFTKNSKSFVVNSPFLTTFEDDDVKIARLSIAKVEGNLSTMDTHYLVAEKGGVVEHFSEEHTLALFEVEDFIKLMKKAGFSTEFLREGLNEEDRGLYIATK